MEFGVLNIERLLVGFVRIDIPDEPGFTEQEPEKDGRDFKSVLNPRSLETVTARLEASLAAPALGERFQFERLGYFFADPIDSKPGKPAFNRIVTLRDTWGKIEKTQR